MLIYLKSSSQVNGAWLISTVLSNMIRGSGYKLECRRFHVNMWEKFFTLRMTAVAQAAQKGC